MPLVRSDWKREDKKERRTGYGGGGGSGGGGNEVGDKYIASLPQ